MRLYDYLANEHRQGKSNEELQRILIEKGYSPNVAQRLVENASIMRSQKRPNLLLISAGGAALLLIAAIALWLILFNKLVIDVSPLPPNSNESPTKEMEGEVKVLVISYFPLQGSKLDSSITGMSDSLASMRSKVSQLTVDTASSLTKASTYHGYKDSNAKPALDYDVIETKEFLKPVPVSIKEVPWNKGVFRPDYELILTSDIDVCDYVDDHGVKEVWMWGYHYGEIEPVESNMAMGTTSKAYWNHGSYGDVSNSEQSDDLPTCNKSYTLYNYNYGRGLGETIENHGHHIESLFGFIDATLWNKFQYPFGEPAPAVNSCGWTHTGPNSKAEYEPGWTSETTLKSNCEGWHPDGSGEVKDVNCHTWYGQTCRFNNGVEFKMWWLQNLPGSNNGLTYQGKQMRSWWEFIAGFDEAIAQGKSLTY